MDFNAIAKPYLEIYPNVFTELENTRLKKISDGDKWDKLCYLPFRDIGATMKKGSPQKKYSMDEPFFRSCVYAVSSLAAWRFGGKHVVKYDKSIEPEIAKSGISGNIPTDFFGKMPFLGVYIEMNETVCHSNGFFVSISEWHTEIPVLLISFIAGTRCWPFSVEMRSNQSISEFLDFFALRIDTALANGEIPEIDRNWKETSKVWLNHAVPLILYLCASNAEITSKTAAAPTIPTLPRNKRAIAPHQPTEWLCGERIGAAIRASAQREANDPTGTGASKRPHIRRAHWHTYRVGVGKANTILKWIHPLAINADDGSDMPVTTRKV